MVATGDLIDLPVTFLVLSKGYSSGKGSKNCRPGYLPVIVCPAGDF
jgi:hypothetical protein